MTPSTHVPQADEDDGDNGDPHAAYLRLAHSLSRAARDALLAPKVPAEPAEQSEFQLLLERLERLEARLFPPEGPATPPQVARPGLATAVETAGLSGVERRVVDAIARSGRMPIGELAVVAEGDVISAVKRAKPKLRRVGWHLFRSDGHIDAKPIQPSRK